MTIEQRRTRARRALKEYLEQDRLNALVDLLADLIHFTDGPKDRKGRPIYNFEDALDSAWLHYDAERNE